MSLLVGLVVIFGVLAQSVQSENSTERTDEGPLEIEKNKANGRTYLFKLSKHYNGEEPTYRNVMQYRQKSYLENYDPETLIERNYDDRGHGPFQTLKNGRRNYLRLERYRNAYSSHLIDPEWRFNTNNQFVEVPDVTNDLYSSMEENAEELKNVSTIRFIFENYFTQNNVLLFDLDFLDNTTAELILDAELHIYRFSEFNESTSKRTNKHPTDEVIRLHQLLFFNDTDDNTTHNPDLHKLLNVIYVSSAYSGWQIFKVRNVVQNWLKGEDNLGFLLTATDSLDEPIELNIGRKYDLKYQPMLIIYIRTKDSRTVPMPQLPKPSSKQLQDYVNFRSTNKLPTNPSGCNKQIWYVSFQELGWNNFVLAPSGFMAFQCRGSCVSPVVSATTNHALFKHLFHSFVYIKRPCCVPDTYRPLIIMFLDPHQNVVIKTYDDMIVDSCACR